MTDSPVPELAPDRITALLRDAGHEVTVAAVDATPVGTGQMAGSFRVGLSFDGDPGAVPATLVAKVPTGPLDRRAISAGSYRTEVDFYRNLAPTITGGIPRCWASSRNDDGSEFTLLLEDLAPRVQGDQLEGCTAEQALLSVENLAAIHASHWCDPGLAEHLARIDEQQADDTEGVWAAMVDLFLQSYGDRLSASARQAYDRSRGLAAPFLLGRPERNGIVHGDYRLDNLLFAPDGSDVAAVDWQTVSNGLPGRDLAYFAATGLAVEDRRALDDDLVSAYHRVLVDRGVADYDLATCRDDYAFGMFQAVMVNVFGSAIAERTPRGDEMFIAMTERSAAAMDDMGTLDLLA